MKFQPQSFTLRFGEEDEELWESLERLSYDQRDDVFKQALKHYLNAHHESSIKSSNEIDRKSYPSEWKLDSLFVSSETEKKATNPLRHLFEVIGEEDDEEVILFLSASEKPSLSLQEDTSLKEIHEMEIEEKESFGGVGTALHGKKQVEVQNKVNPKRSSGLDFILQQVIGEEEDESVLEFFGNSGMGN